MGTAITEEKQLFAALNNCAFVSTKPETRDVDKFIQAFTFLMDSAMIGVGVGFDTKGSHMGLKVHKPTDATRLVIVDDSREGWTETLRLQLESYLKEGQPRVVFDYN